MWQEKIFVFTVYVVIAQAKADIDSTSDLLTAQQQQQLNNEPQQQQLQVNLNAWQPLTGHNNWLILQATAASTMQQRAQEHPVNYYAYNHRYNPSTSLPNGAAAGATPDGNYKQVSSLQLNDSPSYVLAISQALPRANQAEDGIADAPRRQLPPPGLKDLQEVDMRDGQEGLKSDKDVVGIKTSSTSVLDINNYLGPFEQAVLKVRDFCDTLRNIISDTEEEEEPEQTEHSFTDSSNSGKLEMVNTLPTSKEVQGRSSRLANSSQGRKSKKLKRKIQKLFFPLLIAYKLKFLTLIPVLIGGLTLLVGTTGLAGFFFALFTAVMSLKSSTGASHGSKAVLFKKL